jgi:prepilin-type N-terminal cleavage/methylation domain-containing protein
MISTYQRLKRRRDAGEIDGFTLIELLIVIVVLGILAAVVIFALGGITGKSALASCQADGATVSTALAAFNAQNPTTYNNVTGGGTTTPTAPTSFGGTYVYYGLSTAGNSYSLGGANTVGTIAIGTPTTTSTTPTADAAMESILSSTTYQGPYIQSWPSNPSHYGFVLGWVLTTPYSATTTPATIGAWSAQLFVVTGDAYSAGTGSNSPTYAPATSNSLNGALATSIINSATPIGNGQTTGVPALYPYTGPTSCAGVA